MKIRIQFAKYGKMIYIGHLDIMRYFQKALRRADVDLAYTQGFNPHPILSFAAPLGVGITSCGEYADLEVHSSGSTEEMLSRLNAAMVPGMEILDYRVLPDDAKNAMSSVAAADYCLTFREKKTPMDTLGISTADYLNGFTEFLKQESIVIVKETKKGTREMDIRPLVYDFCLKEKSETGEGPAIFLQVSTGSTDNLKPELVLKAYHEQAGFPWEPGNLEICRLETYTNTAISTLEHPVAPCFVPLREMGSPLIEAVSPQSSSKESTL